ncbi:MAG: long-chain fatty acid--CoA ligase [Armatimonadetes bacterium]|nr:long-chain fatty acid--CoA ligase [Armatimonadota bacterium]MDE2207755.1 long-chain fatty acid--CoA ligase [Armatimonadota bacterium]
MAGETLYSTFQQIVARYPAEPAVSFKETKAPAYTVWTYRDLDGHVRTAASALLEAGISRGDRVGILAENRVEWAVIDLAAQSIGAIVVGPYASLPAQQIAEIVNDAGVWLLFLSYPSQRKKLGEIARLVGDRLHCIAFDLDTADDAKPGLQSFESFLALATSAVAERLIDAQHAVAPTDTATLIYTSGTTGEPKGAILSQRAMLHAPLAVPEERIATIGPGDLFLSFLPLSHITERVGGHYLPLLSGAQIVYSQGLATLAREIQTLQPTVMLCVPRLLEAMSAKLRSGIDALPRMPRELVIWSLREGAAVANVRSNGHEPAGVRRILFRIADRVALRKLRARATGGRIRYIVSGGAPLDAHTGMFLLSMGLPILEGYGLSEAGIISINRPGRQRTGTVGPPLPGVELKLADDGEICMRGVGKMDGYWRRPEATHEAIDADGWLRTGDVGELDADGALRITDRKKDIIVLSNGKKVAPQPIENALKASPFIAEAVLIGDGASTISAVIVPEFDKLTLWAAGHGMSSQSAAELVAEVAVRTMLRQEIDRLTAGLADYEKVRAFVVADAPFSIETGELTPTLKVRRAVVLARYPAPV